MTIKLGVVLLRHGTERYPEASGELEAFYTSRLPAVRRTTIVVDNALPRAHREIRGERSVLVGGDNRFWEFSGWDRGLAQLDRLRVNVDLMHFATSAFSTLYTDYLELFTQEILHSAARAGVALGHVDAYDEPVKLFGYSSRYWLRSAFFFLPPSAVESLHSMVSSQEVEEIFGPGPQMPFLPNGQIGVRLQQYILSWLTGEGTGQGVIWHSRFELNETTWEYFKLKTMAILNEHMLSIRLREFGYPIVDITWLSRCLADRSVGEIDWETPLDEQLADRWA